jgi:hypothetical protein
MELERVTTVMTTGEHQRVFKRIQTRTSTIIQTSLVRASVHGATILVCLLKNKSVSVRDATA